MTKMKLNANKKAAAFKMLNYAFFRMVFMTILLFTLYLFASSQIKTNIDVKGIKTTIFVNRLLYSPNSISYRDPVTDRVYPGVINTDNFNENTLNKAFNYDKNPVAARLELKNLETNETIEAYLNKEWYDRWEPLTKFEQYEKTIKWRYVLIKDNEKFIQGLLRIDTVVASD